VRHKEILMKIAIGLLLALMLLRLVVALVRLWRAAPRRNEDFGWPVDAGSRSTEQRSAIHG
jgi:hypothetical protein